MIALHRSHSNSEEVAKTNLSNIVGNILVVHQVGIGNSSVIWWGGNVGLQDLHQWCAMLSKDFDLRS